MATLTPYQRLLERRTIPGKTAALFERYNTLQELDDVKYLLGSMEPMDPDYTRVTLSEAERVHKYLEAFSNIRLQGSVTTNTHIRYFSDVDILCITKDFTTWEGPMPSTINLFTGNTVDTLKALRARCKTTIRTEFPAVTIEDKDRALGLSGGSLRRKVDIVIANWYETLTYVTTQQERDRGIQVLDVAVPKRVLNKPFLHQYLLLQKNGETSDGQNRAIRLLKTLKMDASSEIDISSYDICSLVWNMERRLLPGDVTQSFILASNVASALLQWIRNEPALNALVVPNQTRRVIDSQEGTSLVAVRALWYELYLLLERITKAGKKLDKAMYTVANSIFQV
jgi:hypothetical protein